jgi:surface antigen
LIQLLAQLIIQRPHIQYEGKVAIAEVKKVEPLKDTFKPLEKLTYVVTDYSNLYAYGNCTKYVKDRRPDLPNDLGNANMWYINAQAYGLPTGTIPQVGAVGTTTAGSLGHVVYVEAVYPDGTILISEMNYDAFNVIDQRIALATDFLYIY